MCFFLFRSAVFKFIFPGERRLPVDSVSCISNNIVGRLQYNIRAIYNVDYTQLLLLKGLIYQVNCIIICIFLDVIQFSYGK